MKGLVLVPYILRILIKWKKVDNVQLFMHISCLKYENVPPKFRFSRTRWLKQIFRIHGEWFA